MSQREPIFNVPGVVLGAAGRISLPFTWCAGCCRTERTRGLTAALAFIPARLSGMAADLPGGQIAVATSFVTHQFVHGDLAAPPHQFGLAPRFRHAGGATHRSRCGFWPSSSLAGTAGALLYLAVNGPVPVLVVGASGAISGLMGAAFRFLFREHCGRGAVGLPHAARP